MLREIIKPSKEYYNLHIPKEYMGKNIEVIVLPLFDLEKTVEKEEIKREFNPNDFYAITKTSKNDLDQYLLGSKQEWE